MALFNKCYESSIVKKNWFNDAEFFKKSMETTSLVPYMWDEHKLVR